MNQNRNPGGASALSSDLPQDISALKAQIETLTADKKAAEAKVIRLRASEDPAKGVFHNQEIFQAQQDKLRLDTEIVIRRNKIRRIELGME
ncbi:MAG: hypothetical protein R6W92_11490 [Desulfocurvibacter africanus]